MDVGELMCRPPLYHLLPSATLIPTLTLLNNPCPLLPSSIIHYPTRCNNLISPILTQKSLVQHYAVTLTFTYFFPLQSSSPLTLPESFHLYLYLHSSHLYLYLHSSHLYLYFTDAIFTFNFILFSFTFTSLMPPLPSL